MHLWLDTIPGEPYAPGLASLVSWLATTLKLILATFRGMRTSNSTALTCCCLPTDGGFMGLSPLGPVACQKEGLLPNPSFDCPVLNSYSGTGDPHNTFALWLLRGDVPSPNSSGGRTHPWSLILCQDLAVQEITSLFKLVFTKGQNKNRTRISDWLSVILCL